MAEEIKQIKVGETTYDIGVNSHTHAAGDITSGTIAAARLPTASGSAAGITIVYPAAQCTTFTSDSGTVTPAAVKKAVGLFVTDGDANGQVKVNGSNITVYELPTAGTTLGGVKTTSTVTSTSGLTASPIIDGVPYYKDTNTKNTAGSTDTSSKIFLVGATSQAASPQTYSHDTAYVDTDGYLYSNSEKVWPRIYSTLIPYGTQIVSSSTAQADLNTTNYLKVGNYYCSEDAKAPTIKNCPVDKAFMMQVYSPLSTTLDNETTGTWVYRLRVITQYNTGIEYRQYCSCAGTVGSWSYGDWYMCPRTKLTLDTTDTNGGNATVGSSTKPVYINSSGTVTACSYTLGKSVPSDAVFTDTTYSAATTSAAGLMSAADKTKLDGIATNANNYTYTLPTASSSTLGGVKIGTGIAISSGVISNSGVRSIATGSTNGTISVNTNGTSAEVAVKGLGSNAYTSTAYLPLSGGTVTGTLILSKTNDADGTKDNGPALIIGGTMSSTHIEIDNNEILAKSNDTTLTTLYLGGGGAVSVEGTLTVSKAATFNSSTNCTSTMYITRQPNSTASLYFSRGENPTTTTWTSGDYSYTLKANGAANIAYMGYAPSWAAKRTTTADGTVMDPYTSNGFFHWRNYSINSSTGALLSYYYQYRLYPAVPADLTASKTFYIMTQTNSSISSSTSKRYIMGITETNGAVNYNASVYTSGSVLYGACWNDYAEYRAQIEEVKPGCIVYSEDDGKLRITKKRLQKFEGVVSDTFGFSIGETEDSKTPLAVSGRVLVYTNPEDEFHSGDCVCAGPNGLACRMTREEIINYPDRIVGIVSEIPTYEVWGTGNVKVNGRIWIKVR